MSRNRIERRRATDVDAPRDPPRSAVPLDPIGEFFTRTVGICFLIMTLGKTHFGVSEAAWIKQTMLFNAGMIFFFYQNGNSDGAHFTPWLWQAQAGISAALTFWGKKTMDDMESKE